MLADILEQEKTRKRNISKPPPGIMFVKVGAKPSAPKKTRQSHFQSAQYWEFMVDLKKRLQFPDVCIPLRLDAVLFFIVGKKIIMVELTVP